MQIVGNSIGENVVSSTKTWNNNRSQRYLDIVINLESFPANYKVLTSCGFKQNQNYIINYNWIYDDIKEVKLC
jgi:hypothetical protein